MGNSGLDSAKWVFAFLLLATGIAANYHYHDVAWSLRAAAGLVVFAFALLVIGQTDKGKGMWQYAKDARAELRKVVWPNREEVTQVAFFVFAMVMVVVVLLWGVDSILMSAISWLTGQRG